MDFESSVIRLADYDPEMRTLDVMFTTGRLYRYFGVPESEYGGLITASSAGAYFNQHIRDQYDFVELAASRAIRKPGRAGPGQ